MSRINLYVWNPDLRSNVVGYSVIVDSAAAVTVYSNAYLDPATYADDDAAAAANVSVSALESSMSFDSTYEPAASSLTPVRYIYDPAVVNFCVVSGTILTSAGTPQGPMEIRCSTYFGDRPHRITGLGYASVADQIYVSAANGKFTIPLLRGIAAQLHIPAIASAFRFVVPNSASVSLESLSIEPVDLRRNN